jgi:PAS domain S-box-containing protein
MWKRLLNIDTVLGGVKPPVAAYSVTLAAVAGAWGVRWLLAPLLGDHLPFVTFFLAIVVAAWVGGLRTTVLAMVLSFGLAWYFFVPPRLSFDLPSGPHFVGLLAYLVVSFGIAGFGEAMHAARRRAERDRERFRLAADAVNGIIYEYDLRTGHVERTRGLFEVLGYRPDEVPPTADWWWEQIHPDDRAVNERRVTASASTVIVGEYRVRHKDGRWLHVEDRAVLFKDDAGKPVRMVGCTVDVTEQKATTAALHNVTAELRRTVDTLATGLTRCSRDLRYLTANPAYAKIAGRPVEQIVGRAIVDVMGEKGLATIRPYVERVLRGEQVEYETDVLFAGSGERHLHVHYVPDVDRTGDVVGWVALVTDITDRKRVAAELRRQETFTRGILGSITDAFLVLDAGWRITFVNDEIVRRFGRRQDEIVGGHVWELFPDGVGNVAYVQMHRAMADRVAVEYEVFHEPWQRWFLDKVYPTDDGGLAVYSRDVTDRKRADAALAESAAALGRERERLAVALLTGGLGVYEWRVGEDTIWWSPETFAVFGVAPESFQPTIETFDALVHPDDRAGLWRKTDESLSRHEVFDHEYRIVRPDGAVRWIYNRSHLGLGDGGRVERITGVAADVTDRKRAEEQLRRSEERHRQITDLIPFGAWATDAAGAATYLSSQFLEMVGQTLEEHRRTWTTLIHPDDSLPTTETWADCVRRAGLWEHEYRIRGKDGAYRTIFARGLPMRDGDGPVTGYVGFNFDVTARRQAEQVLKERTAQLNFALAATGVGMWLNTLPLERLNWDDRTRELFFVPPGVEATIELFWSRLQPDDREPTRRAIDEAIRDRTLFAIDHRVVNPDTGEVRWLRSAGQATYDEHGTPTRFDGINYDTTQRKQVEEQLKEADQKKDEFLATLAHELRNPLAPLRNGLQILKLADGDAAALQMSRSMMERQVGQMCHLIDDLMDLSRISRGKIVLQKTRLRLAEAVQDAIDTARPLIEERGHALTVDMPSEPLEVHADRTRLCQVFVNLLTNAAKFTDRGGRIRLAVERQGSDVVVSVEDNGVGIPPHLLTTVFDMFAQVDRSLEKSQGGLGIGLNIVKRLVEMHDGSIVAESDGPGLGSRFVVRLPVVLAVGTDVPQPAGDAAVQSVGGRRILVVDDNRDGADSLATMLRIMGNATQTAHDGLEALDAAAAFRPDVILMDIGMPRLNGYEACRRIRSAPWGRDIIIVAQTGWGQDDDKRKSQEAGFNFHMVKPVDPVTLNKMLAGLLTPTV